MVKNLSKILRKKWFVALVVFVLVGTLPVYALVRSGISSDKKTDAPKQVSGQVASKSENNPKKSEESKNETPSAQDTTQPSTNSTQSRSNTTVPTQPTPVNKEAQPPQKPIDTPVPTNSYMQGSGAWWVDKRWTELGYATQYLGETCSSWRTGAQAAGVSIAAGPGLERVLCQDAQGYSSFGFIEQVRPDGYAVSAYNWAGEAGPKQLVMTSFDGYSFFALR